MYDYKMVDPDFDLEKTIIENDVLKRNNRALGITLVIVVVTILGVMIANSIVKRLKEETKQRV